MEKSLYTGEQLSLCVRNEVWQINRKIEEGGRTADKQPQIVNMWTLTVSLLVLIVTFWLLWRRKNFSKLRELNIPGPEPNIFFGNMLELIRKTPLKCHEEWIKKYGKVVGYYFGSTPMVLIADVDLLKKIQVSDFHKFMNRPSNRFSTSRQEGFSQQLVNLRDKRWKEIRSILTPSFTASKMKQMTPLMNGAIDSLMNNVEKSKGEPIDIYPLYQGLTMDVIGRTAFGIHTDVQNDPNDPFLRSSRALFSNDMRSILALFALSFREFDQLWTIVSRLNLMRKNEGRNPIRELIRAVKEVIGMRRRDVTSRRPDLLQLMMDAQISEADMAALTADDLTARDDDQQKNVRVTSGKLIRQMTDADILANSLLFFLAGYETTSTALAFTTHLLVHHPEVQDKIRQEVQGLLAEKGELDYTSVNELQYLDHVLNESLRIYPPIYLFVNREAGEDVDFGKFSLPKGTSVQVPVYHLHHNEELWSDPEAFRPERFAPENKKHNPMAFQPFGGGPRNCVGMRFAQMEAKLALARLLAKYRLEKCDQTDKEEITLRISPAIINPAKGIYLKAVPCS